MNFNHRRKPPHDCSPPPHDRSSAARHRMPPQDAARHRMPPPTALPITTCPWPSISLARPLLNPINNITTTTTPAQERRRRRHSNNSSHDGNLHPCITTKDPDDWEMMMTKMTPTPTSPPNTRERRVRETSMHQLRLRRLSHVASCGLQLVARR